MRVTLIGPAFPWRGGIPLLVNDLAHRFAAAGDAVTIRTWSSQGPARYLPAQQHLLTVPEAGSHPTAPRRLSWRNPLHWWRTGQAAADADLVVVVHYIRFQAPALAAVARIARRRTRVVVICANVVPHEPWPGDRFLTSRVLRAGHGVLVHTDRERAAARALTSRPVAVAALPPHLPDAAAVALPADRPLTRRLLFFGKVRRYKGVDVLLRALAQVPEVSLTIAGEFYRDTAEVTALAAELADRVTVVPGYLPADRIPGLFAACDALVLPYRTATASQHVALAHRHGLPVIATTVGNFPATVRDGVDGLLCAPGDVDDLAKTLRRLYEPGVLLSLRSAATPQVDGPVWDHYLTTLRSL